MYQKRFLHIAFYVLCLMNISFFSNASDSLQFLSTQLAPVHESEMMRNDVLRGFSHPVEFQAYDDKRIFSQLALEKNIDIFGGLHGDFVALHQKKLLAELDDIVLKEFSHKNFVKRYLSLGRLSSEHYYYVPWMQATYIMAARKEALAYLPKKVDINHLTYEQLLQWAVNIRKKTGKAKLGFPVGSKGLMHRFLQGYLYPSYTGGMVTKFKSKDAIVMWKMMQRLWKQVDPHSLSYSHMGSPLASGQIWIAWDHSARLKEVQMQPDKFVVFPAPSGPFGRGFMAVIAGLAMSQTTSDPDSSKKLIDYLTSDETQSYMMKNVGFFPVTSEKQIASEKKITAGNAMTSGAKQTNFEPGLALIENAVALQANSKDSLPALLPVGLGDRSSQFNLIYLKAFTKIVLREFDIAQVLEVQAESLRTLMEQTGAPCWPPDKPSKGACPIE